MWEKQLDEISDVFLKGRSEECPGCGRKQGCVFDATRVRATLLYVEAQTRLISLTSFAKLTLNKKEKESLASQILIVTAALQALELYFKREHGQVPAAVKG